MSAAQLPPPDPSRLRRGDELIGPAEALAILDVPASTLSRFVKQGALVRVAHPRAGMIFRRADVEALAADRAAR